MKFCSKIGNFSQNSLGNEISFEGSKLLIYKTSLIRKRSGYKKYKEMALVRFEGKHSKRVHEKACLWYIVEHEMGFNFKDLWYENGKPFLKKGYISVSHSEDWIAVYIAQNNPVGVDIEKKRPLAKDVAKRFLSDKELKLILKGKLSPIHAWCAKESFFKRMVEQKSVFLRNIIIKGVDLNKECSFFNMECGQEEGVVKCFEIEEYVVSFTI